MTWFEAILLAVVQGITEFLPISSSGHLVLSSALLGIEEPELLFDIILHFGTLLAIVFFYRRDIWQIFADLLSGARAFVKTRRLADFFELEGARMAALVVVATIPTGLMGIGLGRLIDPDDGPSVFTAFVVCLVLLVNGAILRVNKSLTERDEDVKDGPLTVWNITLISAIAIGIAQGCAVIPGISRSGSTITIALALGATRVNAARFSFLLSIPAILGAVVLKFDASLFTGAGAFDLAGLYITGALLAAVVGFFALKWLVALLEKARFHHFAWYCWAVGIAGVIYFW